MKEDVVDEMKDKYKDMMRKFMNNYNKSGDVRESVNQMKIDRKEDILRLSSEEIEDII
jgi:hypothetical protein